MLTWTTYGTWLQGDERGYYKEGKTQDGNPRLNTSNYNALKGQPVFLSDNQRIVVKKGICREAGRIGQRIYALTVRENHVHLILAKTGDAIEAAVHRYKRTATCVLRRQGFMGKVWTKGYDKRYCYTQDDLDMRIPYVLGHEVKS